MKKRDALFFSKGYAQSLFGVGISIILLKNNNSLSEEEQLNKIYFEINVLKENNIFSLVDKGISLDKATKETEEKEDRFYYIFLLKQKKIFFFDKKSSSLIELPIDATNFKKLIEEKSLKKAIGHLKDVVILNPRISLVKSIQSITNHRLEYQDVPHDIKSKLSDDDLKYLIQGPKEKKNKLKILNTLLAVY